MHFPPNMPTHYVQHKESNGRGQFHIGGDADHPEAAMMYHRWDGGATVNVDHTEVSEELRGQDVGLHLLEALVQWAREQRLKVSATCPFAVEMFDRHEELTDVLVEYTEERK